MRYLFNIIIALLILTAPVYAQSNKAKKKQQSKNPTMVPVKSVRGAASPEELGKYVYEALKNNRFESIEHFFPTETDLLKTENRTPDKDLQVVLEDHTTEELQASFRVDFEALQNKSLEQKVSFRDINLMEVEASSAKKANRILPVNLLLSDLSNQTMALVFEAIKINGRYFLFQHIKVKEKETSLVE